MGKILVIILRPEMRPGRLFTTYTTLIFLISTHKEAILNIKERMEVGQTLADSILGNDSPNSDVVMSHLYSTITDRNAIVYW